MKILIGQFHPGYTAMLCQCPHEFFVRRGFNPFVGDKWDDNIRPKPKNLTVLADTWGGPYDVAIVPVMGTPNEVPEVKCPMVYAHIWDGNPIMEPCHRVATHWVFLSEEVARLRGALGNPKTRIINHGIDKTEYGGWIGGGPVLAIGHDLRSRGDKGHANLMAIAKEIPLTLLGHRNEDFPDHKYTNDYNEFLSLVRTASVYVNPTNWVAQSCNEMMVMGAPVVQFRPIQYKKLFVDGLTCRVVDTAQEAVLRIKELLADKGGARRLGANARALASKWYAMPRFIHQWNRVFEEARSSYWR